MDDTPELKVEAVTKTDILGLNTWDRKRPTDELLGFIARREAALAEIDDESEAA